jgi:hypothetical protein
MFCTGPTHELFRRSGLCVWYLSFSPHDSHAAAVVNLFAFFETIDTHHNVQSWPFFRMPASAGVNRFGWRAA